MPLTSRAKKQTVVIQCVTRTKAECLGAGFVIRPIEAGLGTETSAGSCADPDVAIFASVGLRLSPAGAPFPLFISSWCLRCAQSPICLRVSRGDPSRQIRRWYPFPLGSSFL